MALNVLLSRDLNVLSFGILTSRAASSALSSKLIQKYLSRIPGTSERLYSMASFKKVKDIVTAGNNNELNWGYSKNDERHPEIWYSTDGYVIRYTEDPEIISMCRFYAKPRINVRMIDDILMMDHLLTYTNQEMKNRKVHGMYIIDRDPMHFLAFSAVHVGEFLALKQELIFEADLIEDKPILIVNKVFRNTFLTEFTPIAIIMGMRRC